MGGAGYLVRVLSASRHSICRAKRRANGICVQGIANKSVSASPKLGISKCYRSGRRVKKLCGGANRYIFSSFSFTTNASAHLPKNLLKQASYPFSSLFNIEKKSIKTRCQYASKKSHKQHNKHKSASVGYCAIAQFIKNTKQIFEYLIGFQSASPQSAGLQHLLHRDIHREQRREQQGGVAQRAIKDEMNTLSIQETRPEAVEPLHGRAQATSTHAVLMNSGG